MAKIKGVWVFNDVVSHFYWLASYQMINVTFTSNGERFTSLYWYDVPAGDDTIYHLSYDETLAVAGPFGNLYNWDNDAYKTVDFGSAEQDVSDEFLAWMQENATQQASEETTTPTAEGVKEKLQSLITASNAKTGKSDANLTDAVKTLLEGYGQGGGGECSGKHIIEVDELPTAENADTSAVYFCNGSYYTGGAEVFADVITPDDGSLKTMFEAQGATITMHSIPEKTTDGILATDTTNMQLHFYHIKNENDVFMFMEGEWVSLSVAFGGLSYGGVIANISEATDAGCYYALITQVWEQFSKPVAIVADEFPEVGIEGAYYSIPALTDVIVIAYSGWAVISLAEQRGGAINGVIATSETFPTIEPTKGMVCYVTDIPDIYMYDTEWVALSTSYGRFLGEISNKNEADKSTDGYYAVIENILYQYTNGEFKKLTTDAALPTQEKTVDINESCRVEVTPDNGYTLSRVIVNVTVEDSPLPIEIATETEMTALLETAEVGSVYKYTGTTTSKYENGALYVVEESE